MTKEYLVRHVTTGFFSGTLDPEKLQNFLNEYAAKGWKLTKTIHERRRRFLIFSREAHFAIFERDVETAAPLKRPAPAATPL